MRVVYYANYLIWFEIGRTEFCRQHDFNYIELEEFGYSLVVTEAYCRYGQSARYDELITVKTSLEFLRKRQLGFKYLVLNKEIGKPLVGGRTKHLCVDAQGKSRIIPEPYYSHLSNSLLR